MYVILCQASQSGGSNALSSSDEALDLCSHTMFHIKAPNSLQHPVSWEGIQSWSVAHFSLTGTMNEQKLCQVFCKCLLCEQVCKSITYSQIIVFKVHGMQEKVKFYATLQ